MLIAVEILFNSQLAYQNQGENLIKSTMIIIPKVLWALASSSCHHYLDMNFSSLQYVPHKTTIQRVPFLSRMMRMMRKSTLLWPPLYSRHFVGEWCAKLNFPSPGMSLIQQPASSVSARPTNQLLYLEWKMVEMLAVVVVTRWEMYNGQISNNIKIWQIRIQ